MFKSLFIVFVYMYCQTIFGHPNGNIIVTENNCVLWPYVSPVGDVQHHACIMLWDQDSEPQLWLRSEYESSDFFLYTQGHLIYIIESRYVSVKDTFEARILKTTTNFETPKVLWDWFQDDWHIGVGGFKMLSDKELLFVKYPKMYVIQKGKRPQLYFNFQSNLNKMRPVANDNILLWGEETAWLTDRKGNVLKQWNNLIEKVQGNSPMNRNFIYDLDYSKGSLLIAYWGKQTFEQINNEGLRVVLLKLESHWVPHWVAFLNEEPMLFSSYLDFENSFTSNNKQTTIRPKFIKLENKKEVRIWE